MKALYLSIIAGLGAVMLLPFNTVSAQNEA